MLKNYFPPSRLPWAKLPSSLLQGASFLSTSFIRHFCQLRSPLNPTLMIQNRKTDRSRLGRLGSGIVKLKEAFQVTLFVYYIVFPIVLRRHQRAKVVDIPRVGDGSRCQPLLSITNTMQPMYRPHRFPYLLDLVAILIILVGNVHWNVHFFCPLVLLLVAKLSSIEDVRPSLVFTTLHHPYSNFLFCVYLAQC